MKLAIIRCQDTANTCAGWNCFPSLRDKTGEFARYDTIEVVGFDTCGGCGKGKAGQDHRQGQGTHQARRGGHPPGELPCGGCPGM
jgi:hypothetical protein